MSRLSACFDGLREAGRKALVPFVTAGDPNPQSTVKFMHAMVAAGANVLELGVPFSDPMADGPVIQRGSERALAHGVNYFDVLNMVREFRTQDADTPIILMGYLNPIEVIGYDAVASAAREAGVDGFIVVDMPPEEAPELRKVLNSNDLDMIFLVAPTSGESRVSRICEQASGFIYYVSLRGVTGAANLDVEEVGEKVAEVRRFTSLPVGVGFGIRDGASAARVARVSDAVVVGSALVSRIESVLSEKLSAAEQEQKITGELAGLVGEMRAALDTL